MIHNIPQPIFEQYVTDALARDSNVDLRKGLSFVSLDQVCSGCLLLTIFYLKINLQDSDGVTTTVEERATGHRFQIRSEYLIGCDGARSKVRESLGIECDGEDSCGFEAENQQRKAKKSR